MKKHVLRLLVLLALVACVSIGLVACNDDPATDTTVDEATVAPTEEVTEAPTETPTEEATTEEETTEELNTYEVDLSTVTATGNWPTVDVPVPGSVFGEAHCIALHYGSVALGEMDLSQYSKVTVTYATPDDATVPGAGDQYNKTAKRVMLLNAPPAAEGTFECLPEESAIVAYNQYERSPASLTVTTVEIDLTEVTYNGQLYLTFDFRDANNAQAAEGYLVWLTGVVFS